MTAMPRKIPSAAPTIVGVELADYDVVLADTGVAAEAAAEIMSELPGFANIVPNPCTKVHFP
ncbi:hypothetical protein BTUL_0004g00830 [Botrytis tulipae]|uniref:Uncharacterized protein n=1 Tax=Botrytis tulipae TaxID=87230 RepID=A0A4Z1F4Y0_9HELO|nr:hypothetical protein BTUL_0004g00830 [Botrytis tulipae]